MYDICWIKQLGLEIKGRIIDTMIVTSLLNENRTFEKKGYDLNSVAKEYTGMGKNESVLRLAATEWDIDPKAEMYKLPAMYVGAYAEKDAEITFALWQELKKGIEQEGLQKIFKLESDLVPCLVEMKWRGVCVDLKQAAQLEKHLKKRENTLMKQIEDETNLRPDLWAARSIAEVFDVLRLPYHTTEKTGAPSFTKNILKEHKNPVVNWISSARTVNKIRTTFIETIKKHVYKDKIHADINQLRSDTGGTITGRFSYSNPNLQQIPNYTDAGLGIRSIFSPNSEYEKWCSFDYSQQEPRLVVHYAAELEIPGSYNFVKGYKEGVPNEKTGKKEPADFHNMVSELTNIPRSQAKTINLALFYGMGKARLADSLNLSKDATSLILTKYNQMVPFVKQLSRKVSQQAQDVGYIKTIEGRHSRFPTWEKKEFQPDKSKVALPVSEDKAIKLYGKGNIRRAFTYKALNKLIQGSAADMTKKAMVDLYKNGIVPLIQIHDELNVSIPKDGEEKMKKDIIDIMEGTVKLNVPNRVDCDCGDSWGDVESDEED
jgi:DNA polymerase I-like protein with 3'-5' exonuclease and polymerase domains